MARVSSLGHVGVYVHDIERSKSFYRDILGLTVSDQSAASGAVFLTSKERREEHHELLLVPGREDGKVIQQISFRCDRLADVKEIHRLLVQRNVPINRTVSHGNAVSVYFQDPDGNQVEAYWPTGIDWPQPFGRPVDLRAPEDVILSNLT